MGSDMTVANCSHFDQFGCVEANGFHLSLAAIDLNRSGVDHQVLNATGDQEAMEPKAVPASLVATDDRRLLGKAEATLGLLHFNQQRRRVAPSDGAQSRLLSHADCEGEFPVLPAQFEGEIEHWPGCHGRLNRVSC